MEQYVAQMGEYAAIEPLMFSEGPTFNYGHENSHKYWQDKQDWKKILARKVFFSEKKFSKLWDKLCKKRSDKGYLE